jgi:signal transduction histidine kinase
MNLKRIFSCLWLMMIAHLTWAQGSGLVRGRVEKIRNMTDTLYMQSLVGMAEQVAERIPDSSLVWSGQALLLSRKVGREEIEARCHYVQSLAKLWLPKPDLGGAESALKLAKADFERLHLQPWILKCTLLEAKLLGLRGEFSNALAMIQQTQNTGGDSTLGLKCHYHRTRAALNQELLKPPSAIMSELDLALKAAIQGSDPWMEALVWGDKGKLHAVHNQLDSARICFAKAADLFGELQGWEERMGMLASATQMATLSRDSAEAATLASQAMQLAEKDTLSSARLEVWTACGNWLIQAGQVDSAMKLLRRTVTQARKFRNDFIQAQSHRSLSAGYEQIQDLPNAIRYADSALAWADSLGLLKWTLEANLNLHRLHAKAGDFRAAYRYLKKSQSIQDSLTQIREDRLRSALAAEYQSEGTKMGTQTHPNPGKVWWRSGTMIILMSILSVMLLAGLIGVSIRKHNQLKDLKYVLGLREEEIESLSLDLAHLEKSSAMGSEKAEAWVNQKTEDLSHAIRELELRNQFSQDFSQRVQGELLEVLGHLKKSISSNTTALDPETLASLKYQVNRADRLLRKMGWQRELEREGVIPQRIDIVDIIQGIQPFLHELPGIDHPEILIQDWIQGPVNVEVTPLRIILEAVLENACQSSKESQGGNPRIQINLKREGKMLMLDISDLGIGLPEENQGRLFEAFFKGPGKSDGMGLGLYLAKRAVDRLGGTIQAQNHPSGGAVFSVRFPEY